MGSLAPGRGVGGGGEGAKKLHFSHFFRAPLFARASPLTLSLRSALFVNGTEKCRLSLRLAACSVSNLACK